MASMKRGVRLNVLRSLVVSWSVIFRYPLLKFADMITDRNDRRLAIPRPTLTVAQVEWIVQQVVAYIAHQRRTYRPAGGPLSLAQKNAMRSFFPEPTLDSSRMIPLAGQRFTNPPFYGELIKMGVEAASLPNFEHMAAITFVDTVVSQGPFTGRLSSTNSFTLSSTKSWVCRTSRRSMLEVF